MRDPEREPALAEIAGVNKNIKSAAHADPNEFPAVENYRQVALTTCNTVGCKFAGPKQSKP